MKLRIMFFTGLMAGIGVTSLAAPTDGLAQTRPLSDAECGMARERLAEHARLSDGVRRDLDRRAPAAWGAQVPAPPAASGAGAAGAWGTQVPAPPAAAPAASPGRADTIRARLTQIPQERQRQEDARLGAYMRLDFAQASQIAQQVQALDAEKSNFRTPDMWV